MRKRGVILIIGEQARLGGMVGLEDEYNTNHHDVLLWIDCHYTHDRTHTSLILGDEAAMQRLDKAFKEDTS